MTTAQTNRSRAAIVASKVPEVTIFFWIIKVLATTVGETAADFLSENLKLGLTVTTIVMTAVLAVVMTFQIRARRYVPGIYWLAVVMLSIVGTLVTDNLTDRYGVALALSTSVFAVALIATFVGWYASEGTLSIHSITTRRREWFYWLAILFTFALGTAAGDLIAEQFHLGYATSTLIFVSAIAAVAVAWRFLGLGEVLAFWLVYILTRPLGASVGDLLSQPTRHGGLGLGTTVTSGVFLAAIAVVVVYLARSKRDQAIVPRAA